MAITAYPLDSVNDQPTYWGRALRTAQIAPLAAGASTTRPLGARSGVRPGTPESVVEASSGQVIVHPHAGQLDLGNQLAGPYGYAVLSDEVITLEAAHASYARWDRVCVTLTDPAEGSGAVPEARIAVVTGTASATPSLPAAPSDARLTLATVVTPSAGGGDPSVLWQAPMVGAADGVPHFASVTELNQTLTADYRWVGMCATTGSGNSLSMWVWNGTEWVPLMHQGAASIYSGWSGYVRWQQVGRMVTADMAVTRTDGGFPISAWQGASFANGLPPARLRCAGIHLVTNISSDANAFAPTVDTTGIARIEAIWSDRWVSQGGWLSGSFSYEAATP